MNNIRDIKEVKIKLVLLGAANVGKTSIVTRYILSKYNDLSCSTIGAGFFTKSIYKNNKKYLFEIWDTAGQERYEALIPMYYRGTHIVFIVYDITNESTYKKAKWWIKHIDEQLYIKPVFVLIGNKSDLDTKRKVIIEDVEYYINNNHNDILFYETSAKNNTNIDNIYNDIIDIIDTKIFIDYIKKGTVDIHTSTHEGSICCSTPVSIYNRYTNIN
jgi:small GTP-binding protein